LQQSDSILAFPVSFPEVLENETETMFEPKNDLCELS
jgi:hypothetical protein